MHLHLSHMVGHAAAFYLIHRALRAVGVVGALVIVAVYFLSYRRR